MRTNIDAREVSVHNVGQTASFSIKATGKAFKVLIDSLYSDKIRAVIREIWSNAFDAHVAAGCADKPFDCQLPNQFDPVFRVRDYGTGMDHDTVMFLYTRVFESSKEDTNEQVGKLGLGSKSPFAYTDTFTVTAFSGVEKRIYSAFIGQSYVPQIALMATVPSHEERGIEIQFPVNTPDVAAFSEAADVTSRGFDVLPNITGAIVNIKPLETLLSGNGWKLIKNDGIYGLHAHAKQGCVVYPLNADALDHLSAFERAILISPFFIDFPIGDLEISASRESLGYDDATKANIRARISQIADEIVDLYQADIDAAPTMWQACQKFKRLLSSNLARGVVDVLKARIKYRGKPLQPKKDLGTFLHTYLAKTLEQGGLRAMKLDPQTIIPRYGRRAVLKFEHSTYVRVEAGETIVLFDDADKPASMPQARIRHWFDQLAPEARGEVLWVKAKRGSVAYKRLLVELGRPTDIVELGSLERPPVTSSHYTRRPTKVKLLKGGSWTETEIDENDDIIFVELRRRDTLGHNGQPSSPSSVDETVTLLKSLGYLDVDAVVHGIPQTHKDKIADNPHWTPLWTLAKKAVNEKYDSQKAASTRAYANKLRESTVLGNFMRDIAQWQEFTGFSSPGPAAALYARWQRVVEKASMSKDLNSALSLHVIMGGIMPQPRAIDFQAEENRFSKAYPLVGSALGTQYYVSHKLRQHLIDYVNLVDAANLVRQSDILNDDKAA